MKLNWGSMSRYFLYEEDQTLVSIKIYPYIIIIFILVIFLMGFHYKYNDILRVNANYLFYFPGFEKSIHFNPWE